MGSDAVSRRSSLVRVLQRLGWRFALLYPVLYSLPFPTDMLHERSEAHVASWFGRTFLGVSVDAAAPFTGSGDRAIDYLSALALAVLALVGAALWTALARHDRHDARVAGGVRVYLRYVFRQAGAEVMTIARWAGWYPAWPGTLVVERADGGRLAFSIDADTATSTVSLTSFRRAQATTPPSTYVLQARWADADRLILVGAVDGVGTEILLRRKAWLLRTRGFHWVSPVPYNR